MNTSSTTSTSISISSPMNTIKINMNEILGRDQIYDKIKIILKEFQENKKDITLKRGIYIYGNPGTGKTEFITNLLREQNYDIIKYDAGDIRNKSIIDTITQIGRAHV